MLAGVLSLYGVRREHQQAKDDQLSLARNLATVVDGHVDDTLAALELVAADPTLQASLTGADDAALNARLEHLISSRARLSALVAFDADGVLVALSARDKSQLGRVTGPAADTRVAMHERRPIIGQAQRSAVTGVPLVPLTIPILTDQKQAAVEAELARVLAALREIETPLERVV